MNQKSSRVRAIKKNQKRIFSVAQPARFNIYAWIEDNFVLKEKQYYHLTTEELISEKSEYKEELGDNTYSRAVKDAEFYGAWVGYEI